MRLSRPNNYLIANGVLWALTYLIVTARMLADPMPHAGDMAVRRLTDQLGYDPACIGPGRREPKQHQPAKGDRGRIELKSVGGKQQLWIRRDFLLSEGQADRTMP